MENDTYSSPAKLMVAARILAYRNLVDTIAASLDNGHDMLSPPS